MNPDIQRIAEKWYLVIGQEDGYDIRLTPEKSLLDCIKSVVYYDPAAMPKEEEDFWRERIENVEHWVCDSDLGRVHQSVDIGEIANLTIQLVPLSAFTELSALRDTQERELRGDIVDLETKIKCRTNLWDKANKEIKSLRAELARRDGVEKELREVVDSWDGSGAGSAYGVAWKVKRILRSRIGELEAQLEEGA